MHLFVPWTEAQHAAECGCESISVQAACDTVCETPDDDKGYSFMSYWVYKQQEQRQLLQEDEAAWRDLMWLGFSLFHIATFNPPKNISYSHSLARDAQKVANLVT